jgi:hypothetical protein
MTWQWMEEVLLGLLGYPGDLLQEHTCDGSRLSPLSISSHWSHISSIMLRHHQQHRSHHDVGLSDEATGLFSTLMEDEKSHHTLGLSSLSSIPLQGSSCASSQRTTSWSINEHVHSLSFSEKEWLKHLIYLSERVKGVRTWIKEITELKRRSWVTRNDGKMTTLFNFLYGKKASHPTFR